jgi:transposase
LIEQFFNRLKQYRSIATRYDKIILAIVMRFSGRSC